MVNKTRRPLFRAIISLFLVFVLSTSALSLTSCFEYEAKSKDEIISNIENTSSEDTEDYTLVMQYFSLWGMPRYDTEKLAWVETVFNTHYKYGDGLPKTEQHARLAAEIFLSEYYDSINRDNKTAVTDALISSYVAAVGDPYAVYREPEEYSDYNDTINGTFGGIGIVVEYDHTEESITVTSVTPGAPAEAAGFLPGDLIFAIEGRTIEELGYLNAIDYIRGEVGTKVTVTVIREGEKLDLVSDRAIIDEQSVGYTMDGNLGYIAVSGFKGNTYEQFAEAVDSVVADGAEGIIFDMRNNPGGLVSSVCDMISYLIPTGYAIVSYDFNDSTVVIRSEDDLDPKTGETRDSVVDLPMVVICNEYTASSAEIFTSAIRDYRNEELLSAKIVGGVTYKKGIMQSTFKYKDGSSVTCTIAYYNPPSGENYHGTGITPDVIIDIGETEDLQYKTAKKELEALINANKD